MADYHWTAENKITFLQELSGCGIVAEACRAVSMSPRAAYNLRTRLDGIAFRYAWDAALLLARDYVADQLLDRALNGQVIETTRDAETGTTRRRAYDTRLGLSLLTRLDTRCEGPLNSADHTIARAVARDFDAFLMLVEQDADMTAITNFTLDRTSPSASEIHSELTEISEAFERCRAPVEVKMMGGVGGRVPSNSPAISSLPRRRESISTSASVLESAVLMDSRLRGNDELYQTFRGS